jgi:ribonuclease E
MTEEALDPPVEQTGEGSDQPRPRRRRRGGRGRGRGRPAGTTQAGAGDTAASDDSKDPSKAPSKERSAAEPSTEASEASTTGNGRTRSGSSTRSSSSRRRRGSSGRGRSGGGSRPSGTSTDAKPEVDDDAKAAVTDGDASDEGGTRTDGAPRRRRRRRKPAGQRKEATQDGASDDAKDGDGAKSAVAAPERPKRERSGRSSGPTRTSRLARKGATDRRRRRPPIQVERRTDKTMLMTQHHDRLQIAVLEARELMEHYVTRTGARSMVGNIYLGRVQNVLPGMEAAFVDVGRGRNGVLYAGEVSYDEEVEAGERRIEQALKAGQSVLVQVTKDPLRGKGARLTAQVSLPGRYLVYVPDGSASGISRRLPDKERERLRRIMKKIRPPEGGVIVRTAAEGASEEEFTADLERLREEWEAIKKRSKRARAPKTLYEEPELVERVVRDVFSPQEFQKIVTDDREVYDRVRAYLESVAPDQLEHLELHEGKLPVFEEFHVAEQVHKALERKVWLPSGGYLIIDRVEAMTVIDVNTGKSVGKSNLEETVFGTNLEAAREIARQLRLRDIGGIIVIDFIDMLFERNRNEVIRTLQEELSHDKTRSQVFDITPLGLLEMTRKKVSAGLLEAFSEPCPTCEGRGILLTHDV